MNDKPGLKQAVACLWALLALAPFVLRGQEAVPDTARIRELDSLVRSVVRSDSAQAFRHVQEAESLARAAGSARWLAFALDLRALVFYENGDLPRAAINYEAAVKSLKAARHAGRDRDLTALLNQLGVAYQNLKKLGAALAAHDEALQYARQIEDPFWEAYSTSNIGNVYFMRRKHEEAARYFARSLQISADAGEWHIAATAENNLGLIEARRGRYEQARARFQGAIDKIDKLEQPGRQSIIDRLQYMENLADALDKTGRPAEAAASFREAIAAFDSLDEPARAGYARCDFASVLAARGAEAEALAQLEAAQSDAQASGHMPLLQHVWSGYAEVHEIANRPMDALQYLKRSVRLKDSITEAERANLLAEAEARFQLNEKIEENRQLKELQTAERRLNWALTAVAVLLLLGAAYAWQSRRKLARANRRLRELTRFRERFVGMLVHDLKNPLNAIIGLSEAGEAGRHSRDVQQAARQMLALTLNMLDVQKLENAEMQLQRAETQAGVLIEAALEQTRYFAESRQVALEARAEAGLRLNADAELLTRILTNLLTNAIKYAPPGGNVRLSANRENGLAVFMAEDDGPGVPEDKREAIFLPWTQHESRDAGQAKSTGLGLTFCKMAAEAHGGAIRAEASETLGGAAFRIELPCLPHREGDDDRAEDYSADLAERKAQIPVSGNGSGVFETARKLSKLDVYEISEILQLTAPLIESGDGSARQWAEAVEQAALNVDDTGYRKLIAAADGRDPGTHAD